LLYHCMHKVSPTALYIYAIVIEMLFGKPKKVAIIVYALKEEKNLWPIFHASFEEFFLPKAQKHYYIFTDDVAHFSHMKKIYPFEVPVLPEPLNELLVFHNFLSEGDLTKGYDYICFANIHLHARKKIEEKDIFPRSLIGEKYSFVQEYAYIDKHKNDYPLETNSHSLAYMEANDIKHYVSSSFFLCETTSYVDLASALKKNIEYDLQQHIIPKDTLASYINRYIIDRIDCRILSSSYALDEKYASDIDAHVIYKII
ncbi:MAG: hypothetical protein IJ875_05770, partial [Solobacterium sp.]|nr:hypothetical protein [Solobacterium sp.]